MCSQILIQRGGRARGSNHREERVFRGGRLVGQCQGHWRWEKGRKGKRGEAASTSLRISPLKLWPKLTMTQKLAISTRKLEQVLHSDIFGVTFDSFDHIRGILNIAVLEYLLESKQRKIICYILFYVSFDMLTLLFELSCVVICLMWF